MAFDWPRWLEQNRIEVKTSGANVSRDNIAIHCPFCGGADQGAHMSVNLAGKGFRCWKHPQHRGKNPARLVQALIGCTWERAQQIVGNTVHVPSDFLAKVQGQFAAPKAMALPPITIPQEFKAFGKGKPSEKPFRNYLRDRDFDDHDIDNLTRYWGVYYATNGPYRGRIIFTIRHAGAIVAWTGRTIHAREELRYKALSTDPERAEREGSPVAHGAISHYLLWYDKLLSAGGETIVIVEGPFDALKINVLGWRDGICATCFFTAAPTDMQIDLLHSVCPQFERRVLLLDAGTLATGIRVTTNLSGLGVVTGTLPKGLKDPGEFTRTTFSNFLLAVDRRYA